MKATINHPPRKLAEQPYPAIGEMPEILHLTACEVLCWIGYGRAIPYDVYYRPLSQARMTPADLAWLLHASVPNPKPLYCPMLAAERTLIAAIRDQEICALVEVAEAFEAMPLETYVYAVAVNARGSIEADQTAPTRDALRAEAYLFKHRPIGPVYFRRSEVLRLWPLGGFPPAVLTPQEAGSANSVIDEDDAPVFSNKRPKPKEVAVSQWLQERVAGWPDDKAAPSEEDDWTDARRHFDDGLRRDDFRPIREKMTPPEWRTQGRRKPWGEVKNSAANSAKLRTQN